MEENTLQVQPLVLLASARQDSDTKRFLQTAFQGTSHQLVNLLDYRLSAYRYENDYPPGDGFLYIIKQVLEHQVIVLATPVYWYAMSGLLKTFVDRLTDLVTVQKTLGRQLQGKTVFLVAVGADDELPAGFEVPFELTSKYLNMRYGGCLYSSTQQVKNQQFPLGNHRKFRQDLEEALR